ncbi:unnamed protein product [Phaeothamnion confervicola]
MAIGLESGVMCIHADYSYSIRGADVDTRALSTTFFAGCFGFAVLAVACLRCASCLRCTSCLRGCLAANCSVQDSLWKRRDLEEDDLPDCAACCHRGIAAGGAWIRHFLVSHKLMIIMTLYGVAQNTYELVQATTNDPCQANIGTASICDIFRAVRNSWHGLVYFNAVLSYSSAILECGGTLLWTHDERIVAAAAGGAASVKFYAQLAAVVAQIAVGLAIITFGSFLNTSTYVYGVLDLLDGGFEWQQYMWEWNQALLLAAANGQGEGKSPVPVPAKMRPLPSPPPRVRELTGPQKQAWWIAPQRLLSFGRGNSSSVGGGGDSATPSDETA